MQDLDPSDICKKKNLNPLKRIRVIIRTPTHGRTDGRTDRQTDGQTDGRTGWIQPIPPPQLRCGRYNDDSVQQCKHTAQGEDELINYIKTNPSFHSRYRIYSILIIDHLAIRPLREVDSLESLHKNISSIFYHSSMWAQWAVPINGHVTHATLCKIPSLTFNVLNVLILHTCIFILCHPFTSLLAQAVKMLPTTRP